MKRIIPLLLLATTVEAQFFGLTPQQVQFLDTRYLRSTTVVDTAGALMTNTQFGLSGGNVFGTYNNLTYTLTETDPIFVAWLSGITIPTADTSTITNNGSGQFSVKNYDTNAIARTIYLRNARDSWNDYAESHINATRWNEATNGGALAMRWSDLTGP